MQRIALLVVVFAFLFAVPSVAADEPSSGDPPPSEEPANEEPSGEDPPASEEPPAEDESGNGTGNPPPPTSQSSSSAGGAQQEVQERSSCDVARGNGVNRPITSWFTIDPDGCYRRLIFNLLPDAVQQRLP